MNNINTKRLESISQELIRRFDIPLLTAYIRRYKDQLSSYSLKRDILREINTPLSDQCSQMVDNIKTYYTEYEYLGGCMSFETFSQTFLYSVSRYTRKDHNYTWVHVKTFITLTFMYMKDRIDSRVLEKNIKIYLKAIESHTGEESFKMFKKSKETPHGYYMKTYKDDEAIEIFMKSPVEDKKIPSPIPPED